MSEVPRAGSRGIDRGSPGGNGVTHEGRYMSATRSALLAVVGLALVGCGSATQGASPSSTLTASATATAATQTASTRPTFSLDPNYSGYEIIGFGLGGSECTIDTLMWTFAPDDPIRVNAEYKPSLPAGTTVTIHLTRDGIEVPGYPQTVTFKMATNCVYGNVSPGTLPPGHYRWEVVPDSAPAISAEFDTK